jgi:hypothetical protein
MKTYARLWRYLAEFFLKWEIGLYGTKFVQKIKLRLMFNPIFLFDSPSVYEMSLKKAVEPLRPGHR